MQALKITVLVTNLADLPAGAMGEWGYSALVEVDGHKILFDTGASPELVLKNARLMHIDLSDVEDVVLSHNHWDHVAGLMTLRREFMKTNPRSMSRVHVATGIFEPRLTATGADANGLKTIRAEYLATGGTFVVHDHPTELVPGVWFTGPVPRANPEKNWSPGLSLKTVNGLVEDNVPEDSALVFETPKGTVVLTGCGHAGIVNLVEDARAIIGPRPILAIVGGIHLFGASDETIAWTGRRLKTYRVMNLLAGHCTGIEATFALRRLLGLARGTAVVSAVGSSFALATGITPGQIAR